MSSDGEAVRTKNEGKAQAAMAKHLPRHLTSCGGISRADIGEARARDTSRKGNVQDARETNQGKARAASEKHDPQGQSTSLKGKAQPATTKHEWQQQSNSPNGKAHAATAKHNLSWQS
jgi:hypothetical protein